LAQLNEPADVKLDDTGAVWVTDFENHRVRRFTVGGNIETVAGTGLRGYAGDGGVATDARLLFPFRLLVLAPDQVLVTERENFLVRVLGAVPSDCGMPNDGCTGPGAATCIPGGGPSRRDCFAEFKVRSGVASGVPPRLACVDGDPACDGDQVAGRCTFRIAVCLSNDDARLPCVPDALTSFRLRGDQGKSAAAQTVLSALRALDRSRVIANGHGVAFAPGFAGRNRCTPFGAFVVSRSATAGTGTLAALATTQVSGRDRDKLKLVCLPP
jgi:hypothetical protein